MSYGYGEMRGGGVDERVLVNDWQVSTVVGQGLTVMTYRSLRYLISHATRFSEV